MDIFTASRALAALAQDSRLKAFRLLVRSGLDGLPAGEIAGQLGVPHNTLSTHLATLVAAGLVRSQRSSRSIVYRVDLDGTRDLLAYLVEDCCQGEAALCAPLLDSVLPACCETGACRQ